jgi:hypothetical protein
MGVKREKVGSAKMESRRHVQDIEAPIPSSPCMLAGQTLGNACDISPVHRSDDQRTLRDVGLESRQHRLRIPLRESLG